VAGVAVDLEVVLSMGTNEHTHVRIGDEKPWYYVHLQTPTGSDFLNNADYSVIPIETQTQNLKHDRSCSEL
jgi:hypothetical protein